VFANTAHPDLAPFALVRTFALLRFVTACRPVPCSPVPIKIPLAPNQIAAAWRIADDRTKKYGSEFSFNLSGALGEVAVSAWAVTVAKAQPIDEAYPDLARDYGADIFLGPSKYGVDVKTCGVGEPFMYKESQVGDLAEKNVQAVLWASERSVSNSYGPPSESEVEILGWSSATDITDRPPAKPGEVARRVLTVRPLADLIALL